MATFESMPLDGCAPTPLASYLKALGILRLISSDANHVAGQAADPKARGWWEDERFHIRTTLDRAAMCRFFLNDYAPSPIIAPWNGGSGFYPKDNKDGFHPLAAESVATRFLPLAEAIRIASQTIDHHALVKLQRITPRLNWCRRFALNFRIELSAGSMRRSPCLERASHTQVCWAQGETTAASISRTTSCAVWCQERGQPPDCSTHHPASRRATRSQLLYAHSLTYLHED